MTERKINMKYNNLQLFIRAFLVLIFSLHVNANSQQKSIFDEAMESIGEKNKKYGEESVRNRIEIQRKIFINQGLSEEEIFLNKFKEEFYELYKSRVQKDLIEGGVKEHQALNFIKDFSSELFKCQKLYWEMMPAILRGHAIALSKNGLSALVATSMAQEDYKKKIIASGKTEEFFKEQVKSWGSQHRTCVKSIDIKIENYLK